MNPLTDKVLVEMRAVGLSAEFVSDRYYPREFGNAIAIFKISPMLLKFTRDRSRDFLDMASVTSSDQWHLFEDVKIAMGWASIDSIVARQDVEPLADVIRCVGSNIAELKTAFSGNLDLFVRARLERATRQGFMPPLGGIQ